MTEIAPEELCTALRPLLLAYPPEAVDRCLRRVPELAEELRENMANPTFRDLVNYCREELEKDLFR